MQEWAQSLLIYKLEAYVYVGLWNQSVLDFWQHWVEEVYEDYSLNMSSIPKILIHFFGLGIERHKYPKMEYLKYVPSLRNE